MDKKFEDLNIHQKLESTIRDMVDKEIRFRDADKEFEKLFIEIAAKKYRGNMCKVAGALGIHRNTLHNRAKILKIKKLK